MVGVLVGAPFARVGVGGGGLLFLPCPGSPIRRRQARLHAPIPVATRRGVGLRGAALAPRVHRPLYTYGGPVISPVRDGQWGSASLFNRSPGAHPPPVHSLRREPPPLPRPFEPRPPRPRASDGPAGRPTA